MHTVQGGSHWPQRLMTGADGINWCHKRYMTIYFHLQTGSRFPKPPSLSLNLLFRKLHVRCLSAHSCQVPHRIDHFGRKSNVSNPQLLLWLRLSAMVLPMMRVHLVLPHFDVPFFTNCLSCQCGEWYTSGSHRFIFVLQFIHAGLGHVDQRLAWVFSQSCHVGWLWMGGWKRQSLTSHARVISLCKKRVNWVIHSEATAVGSVCGNATGLLILVFLNFCLLSSVSFWPCRVFSTLNLPAWYCLFYFLFFPPLFFCLSFSYSFSFHPSLWDNIHRTCQR